MRQYVRDREERFLCEWCVVCFLYGQLNGGVGWVGYRIMEQMLQYGYTMNAAVMFQDRVCTS